MQDSRSNRKEARQWLINAIAGLEIQDAATRRQRFTQFLPGSTACRTREHQAIGQAMLQLLFEAAPGEVGAVLAHDASLLRRFFKTDPKRVPLWFGHFRCVVIEFFGAVWLAASHARLSAAAQLHASLPVQPELLPALAAD